MNLNELRHEIESSYPRCPQCQAAIDEWPDADPRQEPGRKVQYFPRTATFSGMCPRGHIVEFHLAEVKAGEITPHDVSERVLGEFVAQKDCRHDQTIRYPIEAGQIVPTENGQLKGPMLVSMCAACGLRREAEQKTAPSGLVGRDGRPLRRPRDR